MRGKEKGKKKVKMGIFERVRFDSVYFDIIP